LNVTPPTLRECFAWPLSTREARRDLLIGGALLFLLLIGWILNLGHRLHVVERLMRRESPCFRGFSPWGQTFRRGLRAFSAISVYLSPSALIAATTWFAWESLPVGGRVAGVAVAGSLFLLAIYALPGGMTWNAAYDDLRYLYRPDKALARAVSGGKAYLHAWGIAVAAITASLVGLLGLGIGFFFTSVWAWSVVGYAFSRALVLTDRPE